MSSRPPRAIARGGVRGVMSLPTARLPWCWACCPPDGPVPRRDGVAGAQASLRAGLRLSWLPICGSSGRSEPGGRLQVLVVAIAGGQPAVCCQRAPVRVGAAVRPRGLRLAAAELLVMAGLTLALGGGLCRGLDRPAGATGLEFYAAGACLFVTLASPGFVWRYLRRRRPAGPDDR